MNISSPEPNTDEESAEEYNEGLIYNLNGKQLSALVQVRLSANSPDYDETNLVK